MASSNLLARAQPAVCLSGADPLVCGGAPGPPEDRTGNCADPCPACGDPNRHTLVESTDRLYATTDRLFRVVACDGCGLHRLDPRPTEDELSRYYPRHYWYEPGADRTSRLEEWYRRLVLSDHVSFVASSIAGCGARGVVLDVGCGGGLFLRLLRQRGVPVLGLDISPDAARVAWQVNSVPALCGSLAEPPLRPESCAAVTMFHVLEHLRDPEAYLRAAHSLLHRKGRLIVQVPNAACWQFLLLGERWNGLDVPRHLIDFRVSDLDNLLDYCGFEVIRHKHFSLRDNPAGLATSLAPSLDPMARRVRGIQESDWQRLGKNLLHLGLATAALPFTLLEAAARSGSTIMVEAKPRP